MDDSLQGNQGDELLIRRICPSLVLVEVFLQVCPSCVMVRGESLRRLSITRDGDPPLISDYMGIALRDLTRGSAVVLLRWAIPDHLYCRTKLL